MGDTITAVALAEVRGWLREMCVPRKKFALHMYGEVFMGDTEGECIAQARDAGERIVAAHDAAYRAVNAILLDELGRVPQGLAGDGQPEPRARSKGRRDRRARRKHARRDRNRR